MKEMNVMAAKRYIEQQIDLFRSKSAVVFTNAEIAMALSAILSEYADQSVVDVIEKEAAS